MKKAILDLTGCTGRREMHERIRVSLDFPDHYGKNLAAFWDCLNRDCDVDFVTVIGSDSVADELKPTVKRILEILERNKQDRADYSPFDYEIIS